MNLDLTNKNVLVTGASGGIGSEIVRQFVNEGAKVAIHYNKNKLSAENIAKELPKHQYVIVQGDLSHEKDVENVWKITGESLGPIQILIANAGVCYNWGKPIHELSVDQWNETLTKNLTSVFLCIKYFFKGIIKDQISEPSAVLMGSTAGQYGEAFNSDYAASKSPLNAGFLLSLKNELARISPRGRINAICPSWTATEMVETLIEDSDHVKKALQTVALRKIARPIDVAKIALFLSSSKASGHCTGQVITAAGGMEGRVLYSPHEINLNNI